MSDVALFKHSKVSLPDPWTTNPKEPIVIFMILLWCVCVHVCVCCKHALEWRIGKNASARMTALDQTKKYPAKQAGTSSAPLVRQVLHTKRKSTQKRDPYIFPRSSGKEKTPWGYEIKLKKTARLVGVPSVCCIKGGNSSCQLYPENQTSPKHPPDMS